jgi:predicted transcriptional regulator
MFGSAGIEVAPQSWLKTPPSQFKHRGRVGIVVDILDTVRRNHPHGRTRTQIMRGARLSYDQTCRYLDFLMLCDFVRGRKISQGDRESISYSLTPNGFELVRQLRALNMAMKLLDQKFV